MNEDVGVPVSWKQLEESSWYAVETSKNYRYYYNRETKKTRWDKPTIEKPTVKEVDLQKEDEVPKEDIDNYKELIKSLNISLNVSYEQSIPKLLFDARYKKIPQSQRKRLFNQLRRELLEESVSTTNTLELLDNSEKKEVSEKRKLDDTSKYSGKHKKKYENNQESNRDTHLRKMAEDNFLSLLYEKVKMPFKDGKVEPLPEEILSSDARYANKYLENKKYLYKKFTSDFLNDRIRLFEDKLKGIDPFRQDLEEVIECVGSKLFKNLPMKDLEKSLDKYKEEKKEEYIDSFKKMLKQSMYYNSGKKEDNLNKAKMKFGNDKTYTNLESFPELRDKLILDRLDELEKIHRSSKNIDFEED